MSKKATEIHDYYKQIVVEEEQKEKQAQAVIDGRVEQIIDRFRLAHAEIERLRAELAAYRPPYSEAQRTMFEDSCIVPPPQYVRWRHLPEVPEPDPSCPVLHVNACVIKDKGEIGEWERVQIVRYDSREKHFCIHKGAGVVESVDVRAWYYEPESAPPKPEGEAPVVDMEPQKCKCGGEIILCTLPIGHLPILPDAWAAYDEGPEPFVLADNLTIGIHACAECRTQIDAWINEPHCRKNCPTARGVK